LTRAFLPDDREAGEKYLGKVIEEAPLQASYPGCFGDSPRYREAYTLLLELNEPEVVQEDDTNQTESPRTSPEPTP